MPCVEDQKQALKPALLNDEPILMPAGTAEKPVVLFAVRSLTTAQVFAPVLELQPTVQANALAMYVLSLPHTYWLWLLT